MNNADYDFSTCPCCKEVLCASEFTADCAECADCRLEGAEGSITLAESERQAILMSGRLGFLSN